jgi:hypothetical protein
MIDSKKRRFVRVIRDWPERVIGPDGRAYPLKVGVQESMPQEMANILIKSGFVVPWYHAKKFSF